MCVRSLMIHHEREFQFLQINLERWSPLPLINHGGEGKGVAAPCDIVVLHHVPRLRSSWESPHKYPLGERERRPHHHHPPGHQSSGALLPSFTPFLPCYDPFLPCYDTFLPCYDTFLPCYDSFLPCYDTLPALL
ncbi:hypothetical protein Pmani_031849 [Petrolisthes manimaculis]|uniref:Uncharacterized protein n=1 Tax=Petrolisthes manimaculis TaxID=1843537 RepID=A0AAE1NUX4_9EUCA|nr:hypothetical protein Pmani_031849 [Petrolisthes manimaculis]